MTYHPKDAEAQYKYFQYTKVLYVHNKQWLLKTIVVYVELVTDLDRIIIV